MRSWAHVLGAITLTIGTAAADRRKQADLDEELKRMNDTCGTSITMAPVDWAAFDKAGAGQACEIVVVLKRACQKDRSNDPHPAAQAFVKTTVKSMSCALMTPTPGVNKAEVKLSIKNGVLAYQVTPGYNSRDETTRALWNDPAFAPLEGVVTEWDIENVKLPAAVKELRERCGDGMNMTIDLASWRKAGKDGKMVPTRLGIVEMCSTYASGLGDVCEDDKTAAQRFSGIRCGYGGDKISKPQVTIKGKEVVVVSGTTLGFGDGKHIREALQKKQGKPAKKKR